MVRHIPGLFDEQNLHEIVKSILVGSNVVGTSERAPIREDLCNDLNVLHLSARTNEPSSEDLCTR